MTGTLSSMRAIGHASSRRRHSPRMDVGDLLQLQRAFEASDRAVPSPEVKHVARERDLGRDLLDALVMVQDSLARDGISAS